MQPIDGLFGHWFSHAFHTVVVGPTVMAIKIAFPFTEKIGNQRLKFARHEPVFEIGRSETFPGSPGFEVVISAIGFPSWVRVLRIDWFRQTLFNGDSRLRSVAYLGRIHQDVTKLHIHTKNWRSFLLGFV